jgi:hypothetical protein
MTADVRLLLADPSAGRDSTTCNQHELNSVGALCYHNFSQNNNFITYKDDMCWVSDQIGLYAFEEMSASTVTAIYSWITAKLNIPY